jgi:hypothetical protein
MELETGTFGMNACLALYISSKRSSRDFTFHRVHGDLSDVRRPPVFLASLSSSLQC